MGLLHTDLLKQARFLAKNEPKKPKQSSLRRSVSASYYALFHLLIDEATKLRKRWKTPIQANNKKEKAELCN